MTGSNTPLGQYADIQALVQKEIQTMFPALYTQYATKYGVAEVPLHKHNGADAPILTAQSLDPFVPLTASSGGVADPVILGGETINDTTQASNPGLAGTKNTPAIYVNPLPIIYGREVPGSPPTEQIFNGGTAPIGTAIIFANPVGDTATGTGVVLWIRVNAAPGFTTGIFTFTGPLSSGATSATLSTAWLEPTGIYYVTFSDSEVVFASFTENSTAVTWDTPLVNSASATISVSGVGWYGFTPNQLIPE